MTQFNGYENLAPPQRRPFEEITHLWTKIFQMDDAFFAAEARHANAVDTLVSVLILATVSAIASAMFQLAGNSLGSLMPADYQMYTGSGAFDLVVSLFSGFFGSFLGFYIGNGLTYLTAKIFGGKGSYGTQAYLMTLFSVPIGILSGLLGWIPCIGWLGMLGLSIYEIVLNVRMFRVVHGLSTGGAIAAVLLPGIVLGVLLACFILGVLALMAFFIGGLPGHSGMLLMPTLSGLL